MSDLLCTEGSTIPAVCTGLHEDDRRLQILLDQEDRFMPCASYPRMQKLADEEQRTRMLEVMYEAVSHGPRESDVYHLAVNLLDRYLSYVKINSEEDFLAVAGGCSMISLKIRRARKECLSYDQLRHHFYGISERNIRIKEKDIATKLKWNLNAVTAADFIEELARRLNNLLMKTTLEKLIDHCHTLANICLLNCSFMGVPPSLLASACLCDAVAHMATDEHSRCVEILADLAGLEKDVLLEHAKNVTDVYKKKLQSCLSVTTPTDIEDIDSLEFETSKFTYSDYT